MANDVDKINEIFRKHDEMEDAREQKERTEQQKAAKAAKTAPSAAPASRKPATSKLKAVDKLFIDETGEEAHNYTGDALTERDYRPVRQGHEYHSGCLGGLMYFAFITCVSVVLACLLWMAASDVLALNSDDFSAIVTLPQSIFTTETVDKLDDNGNKIGTKDVSYADIDYVATALKDAGLIEYKSIFKLFCKVSHASGKMSYGTYELKSNYDYRALIRNMHAGSESTVTMTITFPEGYSMHDIFRLLEKKGVCSYGDLMEAAANANYNYAFLDGIEPGEASRLEGFLFPDTYEFYQGEQASSVINKFLLNFHGRLTADMLKQQDALGLTMKEVLTVASLIEKEAGSDEERATIASVIYNRMYDGWTLGIDSSILYIHPEHEGAPTQEMLEEDSPYNTRLYYGLPPTPICSPGRASIMAALNPDYTGYYYYALDAESGTHRFFTNSYDFENFVSTQNYD